MSNKICSCYVIFAFFSTFFLASCQIRPIYYYNPAKKPIKLNVIAISTATTPIEQKVRNNLIFLMFQGTGKVQEPQYKLSISVTSDITDILLVNSSDTAQAGRVTVKSTYALQKLSDKKVIHKNSSFAISLLYFSEQEFSKIRAIKNAEDRAAKELAENINNDLISVMTLLD